MLGVRFAILNRDMPVLTRSRGEQTMFGRKVVLCLVVCIAASISSAVHADLDYKGVNYTSWTLGDYPFGTSWKPQTYWDSQAISGVRVTDNNPDEGNGSLEMDVHLIGGDPNKSSGETSVDMRYYPPLDTPPCCIVLPEYLFKIPITAKVYCPDGSQGHSSTPNGLQLFVKDEEWRSFCGSWANIDTVDTFCTISVIPDTVAPPGGYMDAGFDPTKIIAVGFKIGANEFWVGEFEGTMWLDGVAWTDTSGCEQRYAFENVENSLDRLERTGANSVALLVTWYMDDSTSTVIHRDSSITHTDGEVEATIDSIHNRGMRVMLKPHVDVLDGAWRGAIQPSDTNAWFDSYRDSIVIHYASIAQAHDVELFCIGTEFSSLDSIRRTRWFEIIDTVRSICPNCTLTYAANWDSYQSVCFWDSVDFGGIDAYFPLSDMQDPPLDTLVNAWTQWIQEMTVWHDSIQKPVIFTEIGYSSRDYAALEPWVGCPRADSCTFNYNCELQARCYSAAINAFAGVEWLRGRFWWNWLSVSDAGGCCNRDFTPQNKPAEDTLTYYWTYIVSDTSIAASPMNHQLFQNLPNPFGSQTVISYQLAQTCEISVKVYNSLGQLMKTLAKGKQSPGEHSVRWDGRDERGKTLPSGIYFCRLQTPEFTSTKKMLLVK